jgi:hypothetical protein
MDANKAMLFEISPLTKEDGKLVRKLDEALQECHIKRQTYHGPARCEIFARR